MVSLTKDRALMIDWQAFDWPTFASLCQAASGLIIGGAAVAGAVHVGGNQNRILRRQADIAEGQSAILRQQSAIDEKRLKSELYDRRYSVFDSTARMLVQARIGTAKSMDIDIEQTFLVSLAESRFLFNEELYQELRGLYHRIHSIYSLRKTMDADLRRTNEYKAADVERETAELDWLHQRIETLHELFPALALDRAIAELKQPLVSPPQNAQ